MSILDTLKSRVLDANAVNETLNELGASDSDPQGHSRPVQPGERSIRDSMLTEQARDMLAELQRQAQENNRIMVEQLVAKLNDSDVRMIVIREAAETAPQEYRAEFPIRGVHIQNATGVNLFFGPSGGMTWSTLPVGEAEALTSSFGLVKTGKGKAMPVNFGKSIYFRLGNVYTPSQTLYAVAYVFSKPCNVMEYSL